jgi:hypothetical protein
MTPALSDWAVCTCGHYLASHVHGTGRCRLDDPFGEPCDCRTFEIDGDDQPDQPREED